MLRTIRSSSSSVGSEG